MQLVRFRHKGLRQLHEDRNAKGVPPEIVEALGLNVSKAAEILKVRRATLSDLLNGKAALTPDMALRIEKAFGPDMNHLLRMQLAYDVAKTREHARDISIKRYVPA